MHKAKTQVINYKKELEEMSKALFLVLNLEELIKLVAKALVEKIGLQHTEIFLYEPENKRFVLSLSRGPQKIPQRLVRLGEQSSLLKLFSSRKNFLINPSGAIRIEDIKKTLKNKTLLRKEKALRPILLGVLDELDLFKQAQVAIPGYIREKAAQAEELFGMILLGQKVSPRRFTQVDLDLCMAYSRNVSVALHNARLYTRLESMFFGITKALGFIVEKIDPYFTREHMQRMYDLGTRFIDRLIEKGLISKDRRNSIIAGLFLHDIGKILVSKEILNAPRKLTPEEWKVMEKHSQEGADILAQIPELKEVEEIVRFSHKNFDGTGYPDTDLKGKQISEGARITMLVDSFDAMTAQRPYRQKSLSWEEALKEIQDNKGRQFDPEFADVFIETVKQIKQNRAIQLS